MDFYSRQAAARGQSRWLVFAFFVALLAVALGLDFVLFTFVAGLDSHVHGLSAWEYVRANPAAVVFATVMVMGVLGLTSLYSVMELRGGGGVVARSLGGMLVSSDTRDLQRKRLLNVVEEMAIASGVPMPEVYVLEQEPAINAFAAGHTPANAAITVTQGALDRLTRDELQGVIGHEFSHVLNGDMRLNVQLMGWLYGLFAIGLIGRLLLQWSPRSRRGAAFMALGFAILVLGYVGLLAGRILQAAVARQRERLADASGAQFTRNPQGLKGALVKIAALPEGSRLVAADAEQAAHMLFAEGLSRVFATHPPLLERIKELDPQFDPRELQAAAVAIAAAPDRRRAAAAEFAAGQAGVGAWQALARGATLSQVAEQVGRPQTEHIEHAQAVRLALPQPVRDLTESPEPAQALVLALLISKDPAVRALQLELLAKSTNFVSLIAIERIISPIQALDPMLRLPVLQRTFPALRRAPVVRRKLLARLANDLIQADARVDVFEFCLAKLLETLLHDELEAKAPHGTRSLEDAIDEIALLFATLAQIGTQDERAARMAYEVGITSVLPMRRPEFVLVHDWQKRLSEALPRLQQLHPLAKKAVIEGLVKTVANDEWLMDEEAELLRTVCALLHCPLPPILPVIA